MSLPDIESSASDSDEAWYSAQRELSVVRGNTATLDQRRRAQVQTQALAQAQGRRINLTNYGSVTLVYHPVQYNSELATGHLGHIAMCKSFSLAHFRGRWRDFGSRKRSSTCLPYAASRKDSVAHELTDGTSPASNGSSRQKNQQATTNGATTDQDAMSNSEQTSITAVSDDPPSSYIEQPAAWFTAGRCFSVWAPFDAAIHEGKFILLDSQNTEGRCVN